MRTELQALVEQKIGRNLLRYQLVEARLKEALPLRSVDISADGIDELAKELDKTKKLSLGMLMPGFQAAFDPLTPEGRDTFRSDLDSFVEKRNWLVHHLLPESNALSTTGDCQTCMDRLDRDYQASEVIARRVMELHQFVVTSLRSFLEFWCEAVPGATGVVEVAHLHAAYLAQRFGPNVGVEYQVPLLQVLDEIMATIETTHVSDDGWVPFAPVGNSMHRTFPNVPPRLLSMAKQIAKYEFLERPIKPGAGTTWMFRRRPADA